MAIIEEAWVGFYGRRAEVTLPGTCEGCGKHLPLTAFDTREWVRLGPLPVFPLWAWRFYDVCPLCGHGQRMKLAEYRHWARQQAASRRDALDAEPGCLGVRLDLAWHLYGLGLMYDALATLAPVLYDDDPPAAVRHCAGVALRTLGRHAEALAQLVAAVEQEPSEAAYRLDLARVLRARRSGLAAAAEQLEAAAEIAPGAAEVWIELAELRTHSHDTTGAQAAWLKAVGLQPELRHAPLYRGLIEQVLGRD